MNPSYPELGCCQHYLWLFYICRALWKESSFFHIVFQHGQSCQITYPSFTNSTSFSLPSLLVLPSSLSPAASLKPVSPHHSEIHSLSPLQHFLFVSLTILLSPINFCSFSSIGLSSSRIKNVPLHIMQFLFCKIVFKALTTFKTFRCFFFFASLFLLYTSKYIFDINNISIKWKYTLDAWISKSFSDVLQLNTENGTLI